MSKIENYSFIDKDLRGLELYTLISNMMKRTEDEEGRNHSIFFDDTIETLGEDFLPILFKILISDSNDKLLYTYINYKFSKIDSDNQEEKNRKNVLLKLVNNYCNVDDKFKVYFIGVINKLQGNRTKYSNKLGSLNISEELMDYIFNSFIIGVNKTPIVDESIINIYYDKESKENSGNKMVITKHLTILFEKVGVEVTSREFPNNSLVKERFSYFHKCLKDRLPPIQLDEGYSSEFSIEDRNVYILPIPVIVTKEFLNKINFKRTEEIRENGRTFEKMNRLVRQFSYIKSIEFLNKLKK